MYTMLSCYTTLYDIQTSDKVPFLADLKPSGKYVMEDVQKIGGTPAVMKVYIKNNTIKLYNNTAIKLLNNTNYVYVNAECSAIHMSRHTVSTSTRQLAV
jgi:dihydroxyacid dehydratase/phosphogluconate dehydratase